MVAGVGVIRSISAKDSTKERQKQEEQRIQALVESQPGLHSSAGVDTGGPHQAWQQSPSYDGAVKQRPKKRNLGKLRREKGNRKENTVTSVPV